MHRFLVLAFVAPLALHGQGATARPADMIVTGARIYTADDVRPTAEGLAVRGGRIVFVGSARGAAALAGPGTRRLDLRGRTIVPGLVDAHAHLLGLGVALRTVDLTGTRTYDEVIARVVARAHQLPAGTWLLGRGWDQNAWPDTHFPTHDPLSRATPDHPVFIARVDGHASLANARAMQMAGVTAATRDPDGGRVLRGERGEPTGVFVDNAQDLVARVVPALTREQTRDALLAAVRTAQRWGLTGVHEAGASRQTIDLYEELASNGKLDFRTYVMVGDDSAALAHYFARGPQAGLYGGRLWIRSVKLYADGALGSRGAALLEPYSDDPPNVGLLVSSPEHLRAVAIRALRAGFQVCTHAIGDRGNRVTLDAYAAALAAVPTADHRFRIEHAQVLHHDDLRRFAELDVIPSMQTVHQTSDMYWATARLGPTRILGAYAWRSLLESGVIIPNGSDFPVEAVNPLLSFHSAVTRQDATGWPVGGWHPEQRMTRDEALKSMTLWPAFAAFQEHDMGTLSPGKYADFVVYDRDIMTVAESDILGAQVISTFVGGQQVYGR
ncbi:MAG: amidohydrolase [Gemmatimonadaceae bacterium]